MISLAPEVKHSNKFNVLEKKSKKKKSMKRGFKLAYDLDAVQQCSLMFVVYESALSFFLKLLFFSCIGKALIITEL